MKSYNLVCLAPDGATVREGNFPTIQAAWDRASDMGSRWFFYPICVVTGPARTARARIMDIHPAMREYALGRTLGALPGMLARNEDAVCAWINGDAPLILDN